MALILGIIEEKFNKICMKCQLIFQNKNIDLRKILSFFILWLNTLLCNFILYFFNSNQLYYKKYFKHQNSNFY